MLEKVKTALRIRIDAFNVEIEGLIAAAYADLRLAGINAEENAPADGDDTPAGDALIERAVILYCKAHFGYIEGAERFKNAYEHQKLSLSLAGDYIAVE